MEYKVIRSDRRTLSMEITPSAELVIRSPRRTSAAQIESFVAEHSAWIQRATERVKHRAELHPEPDEETRARYIARAKEYIPPRVAYYSSVMGVTPTAITVTGAKKRFGSCSGSDRICFSWRLMGYPTELVDYVIVHELAHIKHHDHSPAFYNFIGSVMPDHRERQRRLKYE